MLFLNFCHHLFQKAFTFFATFIASVFLSNNVPKPLFAKTILKGNPMCPAPPTTVILFFHFLKVHLKA